MWLENKRNGELFFHLFWKFHVFMNFIDNKHQFKNEENETGVRGKINRNIWMKNDDLGGIASRICDKTDPRKKRNENVDYPLMNANILIKIIRRALLRLDKNRLEIEERVWRQKR